MSDKTKELILENPDKAKKALSNILEGESESSPPVPDVSERDKYPLRGVPLIKYEDPFGPAVPIEDWEVYRDDAEEDC